MRVFGGEKRSRVYMGDGVVARDGCCARSSTRKECLQDRAVHIAIVRCCRPSNTSHENGVVHRDLKPENIMVDERDGIQA